jgi:hypothetical protein
MAEINYTIRDRFGNKVGSQKAVDSGHAVDLFCARTSQLALVHGLYAELPSTPRQLGSAQSPGRKGPVAKGAANTAF